MSSRRWVVVLVAVLWIATNLRSVSTRSYDWDAAQCSLGTIEFNLAAHQPHPPGYPLWVLSLRALQPLTGGAALAQTLLDFLFTVGALFCFFGLARQWCAEPIARTLVLLLAFSPLVQLYAFAQSTYPVDLFASTLLGWMAWRMWQGDVTALRVALPAAAILMGFRPSGVVMLAPLLAFAALRGFGRRPTVLVLPVLAAVVIFGAWFWPLVQAAGGLGQWTRLNRELFLSTAGATSLLLGASAAEGPSIAVRLTVILGIALTPLAGLMLPWRGQRTLPWGFLVLWATPGLLFVYLIHFAKPGYLLLMLPPLFLALGAGRPSRRAVLTGLVIAELIVLLPYARLPQNKLTRVLALSTPYAAETAARTNRELREQVEKLQVERIICEDKFKEMAPNLRSVKYDFRELSGNGAVVYMMESGDVGPQGTKLVYQGEGFVLWQ